MTPRRAPACPLTHRADEVVVVSSDADYTALVERAKALTGGRGAWAALECLAGDQTQHVAGAVREGGMLVLYGGMAGPVLQWGVGTLLSRMMDLKVGRVARRGGGEGVAVQHAGLAVQDAGYSVRVRGT